MGNLCGGKESSDGSSSSNMNNNNGNHGRNNPSGSSSLKTPTSPRNKSGSHAQKGRRLLLVGAGDSGKSTIFKQLKRIYTNGFTEEELKTAIPYILENIIRNMIQLCHATKTLQISIREENVEKRDYYAEMTKNHRAPLQGAKLWNQSMANDFKALWNDEGIKKVFMDHRSEYLIEDSVNYYFEKLDEIGKPGWIPSDEDLLRTRIKTTGLVEQTFMSNGKPFTMIDVGGQRTERKKWIHQFENVDAILYICSLSEFDQKCYEDEVTNRMKESLDLFESYINSTYFESSLVYLILNKVDLFTDKIKKGVKLKDTFKDYTGDQYDEEAAKQYVEGLYKLKDSHDKLRGVIYLTALEKDILKTKLEEIVEDVVNAENEI
ncbi:hypothetical protein FDP41_003964 [Naegleria fowleri]|uniref:Uncharacterized protein n=1 Tax=Naegleria fowleri TaxID=5763 RepID=A0A6A5BSK2_NAEFO|nr:uncharacterized protein FDP41_003964 [Naegleria fowleri]KAF0977311.1 hypothetical protein FDP41_003964 [Naegleria fowleri]CAG4715594.1 unnamed protein product [Naegleria fowleri]